MFNIAKKSDIYTLSQPKFNQIENNQMKLIQIK